MKSSRNKKKPGSALLMVVGLLTILAMLGGTFLLVASMHRRASASLVAIRSLDDLAKGIASQVAYALLKDRYIGEIAGTGVWAPYAAVGPTGEYTDSATGGTDDLLSDAGGALFQGAQGSPVDTDGDGEHDSFLYPTGVFNADGEEVYAAVKVVDLSGRICVNTAYDKTAAAAVTHPVYSPIRIGLKEMVGPTAFTALHTSRCATGGSAVQAFRDNCALVLSAASAGGYEPFSIEDELFLRWMRPGAATITGRLYSALDSGGFTNRGLLTTTARSRSILRIPEVYSEVTFRNRLLIDSLGVMDGAEGTDGYKKRRWLLNELYKALGLDVDAEGDSTTIDDPSDRTGGWWGPVPGNGYEGDDWGVNTFAASGVLETATWTFAGLTAGADYKVAVTWTTDPDLNNRASNAAYTIKDDATVEATVTVNQKTPGTDFEDGGVGWKNLGTYTIDSGTLKVELSNDADSYVSADAVRITEIVEAAGPEDPDPPADIIIDDQGAGADPQPALNWLAETFSIFYPNGYSDTTTNDQASNKGVNTFTFTPTIPVAGSYNVYMWWPSDPYSMLDTSVPVSIVHQAGTENTTVNQNAGGGAWNQLGTFSFDAGTDGKVIISTTGTFATVAADAVKFEFAGTVSSVEPKHVEHFVANLWAYLSTLSSTNEAFRVSNAYGVVPQLVITEAYAYSVKESPAGGDHGWAYAIELMNPTSEDVDAGNYSLIGPNGSWDFGSQITGVVAPGGRIVLYDFGGKIGSWVSEPLTPRANNAQASDFFSLAGGAQWIAPTAPDQGKLDFAAANAAGDAPYIRIVRVVGAENIPVDSVCGNPVSEDDVRDIDYGVTNKQTGAGGSTDPNTPDVNVAQRDDDIPRGRSLVAVMKKITLSETSRKTGHTLGDANGLDETELADVHEGFFIRNLGQTGAALGEGDSRNLGKLMTRYIAGPASGSEQISDMPHQLAASLADYNRARINHNCTPPGVPQGYPAVAWPNVIGELLELVTPHTASKVIYGRININTAPEDVLAQLPWPSSVTTGPLVSYTVTADDINGTDNPNSIVKTIASGSNRPYYTPGQVAGVLAAWVNTHKLDTTAKESAGYSEAQYALYDAISNSITNNSETFAVYIRTQVGPNTKAGAHYHVAVIDRSNCSDNDDRPQILMFAQIR